MRSKHLTVVEDRAIVDCLLKRTNEMGLRIVDESVKSSKSIAALKSQVHFLNRVLVLSFVLHIAVLIILALSR